MKMWNRLVPGLLVLLLGAALAQPAQGPQQNPVSFELETYIVSEVTGEDGNREERFTAATSARPGQVVEYRITASNVGETTLPAGTVVVTGPVPDMTHYLEGSATPSSEAVLTEFTADGVNWSEPPVLVAGQMARPDAYTAVRWTLLNPLEPGEAETLIYRVVVE